MDDLEETSENGFKLGFPEVGTWNRTHNVPLENMKIDAPMVNTYIYTLAAPPFIQNSIHISVYVCAI